MTNEMRYEIIKAFAYGLDEQTVAKCNGVGVEEVKEIMSKYSNEIPSKKNEIKEVYGDVF